MGVALWANSQEEDSDVGYSVGSALWATSQEENSDVEYSVGGALWATSQEEDSDKKEVEDGGEEVHNKRIVQVL